MKKSILILGGGYVGLELFKDLIEKGYDVKIKSAIDLDYSNSSILNKYLLNSGTTHVIGAFGFTGRPNVDECEVKKDECWNLNVVIPLNVLNVCNRLCVKYIHISSGCIYNGYKKRYTEIDIPNFGLYDDSSFYSKSKHAFETLSVGKDVKILRLRMPIDFNLNNQRNYLWKIMNYYNLISYHNSKTFLPDLSGFVDALFRKEDMDWRSGQDIYNIVNSNGLATIDVVETLNSMNKGKWKLINPLWVDMEDLKILAPRSNCLLSNTKASKIYNFKSEIEVLNMICNKINGISTI